MGPEEAVITNGDYWFKVVETLQQKWALIDYSTKWSLMILPRTKTLVEPVINLSRKVLSLLTGGAIK